MVAVVNVKGLRTPADRAGVVYVGRPFAGWPGHPLANPFRLALREAAGGSPDLVAAAAAARAACLARYREWLLARPTLEADLAALWAATGAGAKPLGCWCTPLDCHADVLAAELAKRFGPEGE